MKTNILFFKNTPLKKAWLLTLLDLMMLMLTFFIMLYSMSTPNVPMRTKNIFNASIEKTSAVAHAVHLNYLEQILSQKIKDFENYHVFQKENLLHLQISQDIFEDASRRTISEQEKKHIQALGEVLNNISNRIILHITSDEQLFEEKLSQGMFIANLLKQGGYAPNLRIVQSDDLKSGSVEIIIFPQIRGE